MKKLLMLIVLLAITTISEAGSVGWLSSEARDWAFIQKNGGVQIAAPTIKEGKRVLPVTCYISKYNSGLVVRRVEVKRKDSQIAIRIFTSLPQKDGVSNASGFVSYADLSTIPDGKYDVYYEHFGDRNKFLGVIEIQNRLTIKSFKGIELYSWQRRDGLWSYSLLPGTNRLRTEAEVKHSTNQMSSLKELANRFSQLAEGEQVYWFLRERKEFAYPDSKTLKEIKFLAEKANIILHISQQ